MAEAFRQVNPADPKQAETEYAQRNPTKRLGLPEEVAKVVAFLLSDDASCLNGQTIAIDEANRIATAIANLLSGCQALAKKLKYASQAAHT